MVGIGVGTDDAVSDDDAELVGGGEVAEGAEEVYEEGVAEDVVAVHEGVEEAGEVGEDEKGGVWLGFGVLGCWCVGVVRWWCVGVVGRGWWGVGGWMVW